MRFLKPHQYTVGWICALPTELVAAKAMLDEEHKMPTYENPGTLGMGSVRFSPADANSYTCGRMGVHNVVIACLPKGRIGTNAAAWVAANMMSSFPSIQFGTLVGIAGGVPHSDQDIRLGDVVVSVPIGSQPGVVQYDLGKTGTDGHIEPACVLNGPPGRLLSAVSTLQSQPDLSEKLQTRIAALERASIDFSRDQAGPDILYSSSYDHVSERTTCNKCAKEHQIHRKPRNSSKPTVHYGTIASGNQVMKDGITRDRLSLELGGVLCFEMEAAALMNDFPCIAIRGISDYADSHKNKTWQPHAAAAAAAYAKELLLETPAIASQVHERKSTIWPFS